jgi:hypothetical protein
LSIAHPREGVCVVWRYVNVFPTRIEDGIGWLEAGLMKMKVCEGELLIGTSSGGIHLGKSSLGLGLMKDC